MRSCRVFIVVFILLTQYCMLNLVTGIIVENFMDTARSQQTQMLKQIEEEKKNVIEDLTAIFVFANHGAEGEMTAERTEDAPSLLLHSLCDRCHECLSVCLSAACRFCKGIGA